MSKEIIFDEVTLEILAPPDLPRKAARKLHQTLRKIDWTSRLQPELEQIAPQIRVVDASGGRFQRKKVT